MKSILRMFAVTCCALLTLSLAAAETAAPAAFSGDDLVMDGLRVNAADAEISAALTGREYTKQLDYEEGATAKEWYVGNMVLTVDTEKGLVGATALDDTVTGPRGLKVGMTANAVVKLFKVDGSTGTSSVFYSAGATGSDRLPQLPPCGYVQRDADGSISFVYMSPLEPYGDDGLSDPARFITKGLDELVVKFDQNGNVSAFSWSRSYGLQ